MSLSPLKNLVPYIKDVKEGCSVQSEIMEDFLSLELKTGRLKVFIRDHALCFITSNHIEICL
jgi:hypothetical protein